MDKDEESGPIYKRSNPSTKKNDNSIKLAFESLKPTMKKQDDYPNDEPNYLNLIQSSADKTPPQVSFKNQGLLSKFINKGSIVFRGWTEDVPE